MTNGDDHFAEGDGGDEGVGYKRPPRSTRFRKGQSGNPKGRPKGSRRDIPYEAVLGQKVTVRDGCTEKSVTAAEAFLLHLTKSALAGESAATKQALASIEEARTRRVGQNMLRINHFNLVMVEPGSVNGAVESLRMGRLLDRRRKSARLVLEPWLVEAALKRLGNRRLSAEQQATIMKATRTPWKVQWPEWWAL